VRPRKRLCILGSTGSIGENTLRVVADWPDRFEIVGLAAHASGRRLAEQVAEWGVKCFCLSDETQPAPAIDGARLFRGERGMNELLDACAPDLVVVATVGYAGLAPTLHAIEAGATVALANKEVLVTAGELVMAAARRRGATILPIDSEHNAVFQCLAGRCENGGGAAPLRRIVLTASGGPFRGRTRAELADVTVQQALNHPTWSMGPKITIDSATLMNKGFEVIETHHLFGEPVENIEVVIHPQSVIHGMIEYHDGSMLAQMGVTDMYLPIANVLGWPERLCNDRFEPLDLAALSAMTFEAPDTEAFPCLRLAYEAIRSGDTYPTVLNAVNEVAVQRFLAGEIRFTDIPDLIERALGEHRPTTRPDLAAIAETDAMARDWCRRQPGSNAAASQARTRV
jgi:1-deoxy-D-xylulose-5-phosphate reductoisomerase